MCKVEPGWTCTGLPSKCYTTCGDGIKAGIEECDDSNMVSNDGCSSLCIDEGASEEVKTNKTIKANNFINPIL